MADVVLSMQDYVTGNDLIQEAKGKIGKVLPDLVPLLTLVALEYLAGVLDEFANNERSGLSRQDGKYSCSA
jgi:hypothetical protein